MGKNLARTERIELEAKVWKEPNRTATDMQKTCRIGTDRTEHTNTNKLESNHAGAHGCQVVSSTNL